MDQINMSVTYVATEDAVESRLGEETVILHLESVVYFGLDAIGTRIWEVLQKGASPDVICKIIRQEFTEVGDALESDIRGFFSQLSTHKLISEK